MDLPKSHIRDTTRYRQLDSLRGIAALCVFFSHYFMTFKITGNWDMSLKATPLGLLVNGNSAVMFFFVLSGFVLSLPFVNTDKPLELFGFYIKRIFRIYPAYLAAIVIAIILKTFVYDKNGLGNFTEWIQHFWLWNWNIHNYKEILKTFLLIGPNFNADLVDPVIWSLVVEMKMSLLLPFFIVIVSRSNLFFNLLFFFVTLSFIYNHQAGYLFVFYLGVLTAKYKDQIIGSIRSLNPLLLAGAVVFCLLLYNVNFMIFKPFGDNLHPFGYFWRDALTSIGSCFIILIVIARKRISNVLQHSIFVFIGDISYSFYLLHLPILITVCSLFPSATVLNRIFIFLSTIICAGALSYFALVFIEHPFQDYARRLTKKKKPFFNLIAKS